MQWRVKKINFALSKNILESFKDSTDSNEKFSLNMEAGRKDFKISSEIQRAHDDEIPRGSVLPVRWLPPLSAGGEDPTAILLLLSAFSQSDFTFLRSLIPLSLCSLWYLHPSVQSLTGDCPEPLYNNSYHLYTTGARTKTTSVHVEFTPQFYDYSSFIHSFMTTTNGTLHLFEHPLHPMFISEPFKLALELINHGECNVFDSPIEYQPRVLPMS